MFEYRITISRDCFVNHLESMIEIQNLVGAKFETVGTNIHVFLNDQSMYKLIKIFKENSEL